MRGAQSAKKHHIEVIKRTKKIISAIQYLNFYLPGPRHFLSCQKNNFRISIIIQKWLLSGQQNMHDLGKKKCQIANIWKNFRFEVIFVCMRKYK